MSIPENFCGALCLPRRPAVQLFDQSDIADRNARNKQDQQNDPPDATHKIGHLRTKAERTGGRIPIEEKVGIIVAAAEIPIERIPDTRKYKVIHGRDQRKEKLLIAELLRTAEEQIDHCGKRHDDVGQHVRRRSETVRHGGSKHATEDDPRQGDRDGEHKLDDVQSVRDHKSRFNECDEVQHKKYGADGADPEIGLYGKV